MSILCLYVTRLNLAHRPSPPPQAPKSRHRYRRKWTLLLPLVSIDTSGLLNPNRNINSILYSYTYYAYILRTNLARAITYPLYNRPRKPPRFSRKFPGKVLSESYLLWDPCLGTNRCAHRVPLGEARSEMCGYPRAWRPSLAATASASRQLVSILWQP